MTSRTRTISATIFLCALVWGGLLLPVVSGPASAAFTATAVGETTSSAVLQTPTTETEQQSMLPALLVATSALALTLLRIFHKRRSKESDT